MSLALSDPRASALAGPAAWRAALRREPPRAQVLLLGVGSVGSAFLRRWERLASLPELRGLRLAGIANSRGELALAPGRDPLAAIAQLAASAVESTSSRDGDLLGARGTRIVVDATASDAVASSHAAWLARGIHVVTACKLGQGTSLERWHAIRRAVERSGARYDDAATVGAGLPLLRTLRELRRGGDRIHAIAGVLSGALGWLLSQYDGSRPFSDLVREAARRGYTEPDPRDDLSGKDVRRKLLILARAAGFELEADLIAAESLLPEALAALVPGDVESALELLDVPMRERLDAARADGRRLRYVARFDIAGARVGLEALSPEDPLAQGGGCDNRVTIRSDRYDERPLVVQGPGAGAEVTAAALLDEVLEIARRR
jgi:homoserine dehydrogenase